MQIGTLNTAPFVELADLAKIQERRNARALENSCQSCIQQLDGIGKELDGFAQNVEGNTELFEFLANVLRASKNAKFRFKSAAQLHSELRSIRNVIRRMRCGSANGADYELYLSFSGAIESEVETKARVAA